MTVHVAIELDPGPWVEPEFQQYRPAGGTLSGQVVVRSDERLSCRGIRLAVGWHTEGRGDRDEGMVFATTLHEGQIGLGDLRLPFSVDLPDQPISYTGRYVSIVWDAMARVDLAWKKDPEAREIFYLLPATAS